MAGLPRVLFPENTNEQIVRAAESLQSANRIEAVFIQAPIGSTTAFEIFSELAGASEWREKIVQHSGAKENVADFIEQSDLNLASGLLNVGYVDLVIAGASYSSQEVLRAGLKGLGLAADCKTLSSSFLMCLPDKMLTYADCAVIPDPTAEQLADIAVNSAHFHQCVTGETAKVAMLSFSTKGSSNHQMLEKVRQGVALAKQKQPDLHIDGELQFDAAIIPSIAERKLGQSDVAGKANVLVFPDLNAANIACKITQYLAGAGVRGPFLHGLSQPWLDMCRGSSTEDIIETTIMACSLLAVAENEH